MKTKIIGSIIHHVLPLKWKDKSLTVHGICNHIHFLTLTWENPILQGIIKLSQQCGKCTDIKLVTMEIYEEILAVMKVTG